MRDGRDRRGVLRCEGKIWGGRTACLYNKCQRVANLRLFGSSHPPQDGCQIALLQENIAGEFDVFPRILKSVIEKHGEFAKGTFAPVGIRKGTSLYIGAGRRLNRLRTGALSNVARSCHCLVPARRETQSLSSAGGGKTALLVA
jgi:hypothetical protein